MPRQLYKSFIVPGLWLLLFGVVTVIEKTTWGNSGHPSNGLVMFILLMMAAPIFGVGGLLYSALAKSQESHPIKQVANTLNIVLIGAGLWVWLTWFH